METESVLLIPEVVPVLLQHLMDSGTQASSNAATLGIEDPRVLGPLAAFVFAVFVFEIVVPGKAYKREVAENERLREMTAKTLPLLEEVVEVAKQMITVTEASGKTLDAVGRAFEDFLDYVDENDMKPPTRRRR